MKFNHLARHYNAKRSEVGFGDTLTVDGLEAYVNVLKEYVSHGGHGRRGAGLCYYADRICGVVAAYSMWYALIECCDVAYQWELHPHKSGRTPERIEMTKALLVELEEAVKDGYANR